MEYSLYLLLGSLAAYISIFDFGLNNTISRYVAKYRQENDKQKESDLLGISFLRYAAIAVFILSAGLLLLGHISFFSKDHKPENLGLQSAVPAAGGQRGRHAAAQFLLRRLWWAMSSFVIPHGFHSARLAMPLISIPCLYLGGGSL